MPSNAKASLKKINLFFLNRTTEKFYFYFYIFILSITLSFLDIYENPCFDHSHRTTNRLTAVHDKLCCDQKPNDESERILRRFLAHTHPLGLREFVNTGGAAKPAAAARRPHAAKRHLGFAVDRLVVDVHHARFQLRGHAHGAGS